MRTETEMHDLVVAKVAAHRRRRALVASAGGGVAVVLLLVAVAAGATGSGPDDSVKAGEGDPTSTTEAPTTTDAPGRSTTTVTTTTAPETTTTTTTTSAPPPETTPPPPETTTEPPATTTAPEPTETSVVLEGTDGDLHAVVTIWTDPATPGRVAVVVEMQDPTGQVVDDPDLPGPSATIGSVEVSSYPILAVIMGDAGHGCPDAHVSDPDLSPASFMDSDWKTIPSGTYRIRGDLYTGQCTDAIDHVVVEGEIVVP